jgi:hypothetical protein
MQADNNKDLVCLKAFLHTKSFYTLDEYLIRNEMAGYINVWNLHHAYVQNVNAANGVV